MNCRILAGLLGLVVLAGRLCAEDAGLADVVAELRRQNQALQEQVQKQNAALESLTAKVATLETRTSDASGANDAAATSLAGPLSSKVHLSGEGAVGFFHTGSKGRFPDSEFRVDEARLFLDAAIWENVFGFVELNLATSEGQDLDTRLGEIYVDFEDVSLLWGHEGQMGVRLGRMDVPFGEEYLTRDAIDNPLISHSVMDFWGIDEGIELYGEIARVSYVFALQNGSLDVTGDTTDDKSLCLRLGYDPARWLHVGASAMDTGELDVNDWSEIWIGNGIFRPIGSAATTSFRARLAQGEAKIRLPRGHLHFAGGFARYDDNDTAADNQRDFWFWSAEAVQDLSKKFYVAARFSQIWVDNGYPLPGQGDFNTYFFGDLTDELWRLSLGLGCRLSENLILKAEYSMERGNTLSGDKRDEEDMISAAAAFKF